MNNNVEFENFAGSLLEFAKYLAKRYVEDYNYSYDSSQYSDPQVCTKFFKYIWLAAYQAFDVDKIYDMLCDAQDCEQSQDKPFDDIMRVAEKSNLPKNIIMFRRKV